MYKYIFKWTAWVLWIVIACIIQVKTNWKSMGLYYLGSLFFACYCMIGMND